MKVRIEGGGIRLAPDRHCYNDGSRLRVHDCHPLVIACSKKTVMVLINGKPAWAFTGRQRKVSGDRECLGVDSNDLILVLNIHEDGRPVGYRKLRNTAERDRLHDLTRRRLN